MSDKQDIQERILSEIWEVKRRTPHHTMEDQYNQQKVASLKYTLAGYSDELLERVSEYMGANTKYALMIANCVAAGEKESLISEYMRFVSELVTENDEHLSSSLALIRGLHFYAQLPKCDDFGTASSSVQSICSNLLRVAAPVDLHLYATNTDPDINEGLPLHPVIPGGGNSDMYMIIEDQKLIDLVISSSDRAVDLIIATIKERNTVEVDELLVVLESPSPTVSEGAL